MKYNNSIFSASLVAGICLGVMILIGLLAIRIQLGRVDPDIAEPIAVQSSTKIPQPPPVAVVPEPTPKPSLPEEVLLDLPFTSQAPFAIWDKLHKEACEEASLLMVRAAKLSIPLGSAEEVDVELKKFIAWQTDNGYGYDVTVKQLQKIATDFYGFNGGKILENPTITDLKEALAAGSFVIVPAAGKELPNPYFTPPGPNYHMFVIRGYNKTEFITNDPGTKRGEKLRYTHQALLDALHDYTPDDITTGKKQVLVY